MKKIKAFIIMETDDEAEAEDILSSWTTEDFLDNMNYEVLKYE